METHVGILRDRVVGRCGYLQLPLAGHSMWWNAAALWLPWAAGKRLVPIAAAPLVFLLGHWFGGTTTSGIQGAS